MRNSKSPAEVAERARRNASQKDAPRPVFIYAIVGVLIASTLGVVGWNLLRENPAVTAGKRSSELTREAFGKH